MNPCYMEPLKCSSQLFGARKKRMTAVSSQKLWFTAIWSTKKMDPDYLKVEKNGSQPFRSRKIVSQLFAEVKTWIPAIMSTNHSLEALCREQKVDPCYLDTKICS